MTNTTLCDGCGNTIIQGDFYGNTWELGVGVNKKHIHNNLDCLEAYINKLKKEKTVDALTSDRKIITGMSELSPFTVKALQR